MLKVRQGFAVCILIMLFGAGCSFYAQTPVALSKHEDLAAMSLQDVRIKAQSIGSLFSDLSLSYDIPIGLETVPGDDEFVTYNVDFKKRNALRFVNAIYRPA